MNIISHGKRLKPAYRPVCLFIIFLFLPGLLFGADTDKIMVINSNVSVEKYQIVQEEFIKTIPNPIMEVDLGGDGENDIDLRKLHAYDPKLIYCIGGKAYSFARNHFEDKNVVFTSIINWLRLPPMSGRTYGVSNELHPRMPIFMFRTIFPNIRKIGVLYSKEFTEQWYTQTKEQGKELGIDIVGEIVSDKKNTIRTLEQLIESVDALWLISDPMVMPTKQYLFDILNTCDKRRIPIFSYHDAFARFGAVLIVSVDDPTIGRQAAGIAIEVLSGNEPDQKVQFPAGSHVTLNLRKIEEYNLEYNKDALGSINNIIK